MPRKHLHALLLAALGLVLVMCGGPVAERLDGVAGVGGSPAGADAGIMPGTSSGGSAGSPSGMGGAVMMNMGGAPMMNMGGAPMMNMGGAPMMNMGGAPMMNMGGAPMMNMGGAPMMNMGGAPMMNMGGAPMMNMGGAPMMNMGGAPMMNMGGVPMMNMGGAPMMNMGGAPTPPADIGRLLAYASFNGSVGPLHNLPMSGGFATAWEVQTGDVVTPGFEVSSMSALTFGSLLTSPNYAEGGLKFLASGARFDISTGGAFAEFLDATSAKIGNEGKTLWLSALMRKQTTSFDTDIQLSFHGSSFSFWDSEAAAPPAVTIGQFGADSVVAGKSYWSLRVGFEPETTPPTPPTNIFPSAVEIVPGQTVFLVVSITYAGANSQVALFANPTTLGGAAPAPTLLKTTSSRLLFSSVKFFPGGAPGNGSLDELRVGTSYAAVTPLKP